MLASRQRDESVAAKTVLAAGILVNLGILGYYKYFDFFLRIVNRLTGSEHEMRNIPLPIGISFFTFGAISYLMDLYRGHYEAEKKPLNMALYLSLFPKISVGPIARYRDFGPQLVNRQETVEKTAEGIRRFAYGLGKKVLVANIVGASVDKIYAQDITNVTGVMVWCAAILYAIQIYYDFSGFTDMANGLGKMFGFDICENFNYPYLSGSIQEFWRHAITRSQKRRSPDSSMSEPFLSGFRQAVCRGNPETSCSGKYGFNRDSEADEGQLQRLSGTGGECV